MNKVYHKAYGDMSYQDYINSWMWKDKRDLVLRLRDRGIGILITDHNVRDTLEITDRAYILNEGKIIEEGTSETIAQSEQARNIYLGRNFSLK